MMLARFSILLVLPIPSILKKMVYPRHSIPLEFPALDTFLTALAAHTTTLVLSDINTPTPASLRRPGLLRTVDQPFLDIRS